MGGTSDGLGALSRRDARALRSVLIASVAAASRPEPDPRLPQLIAAAPVRLLPDAAALHRVAGTVHRGLAGVPGVPDGVRAALAAHRDHATVRHLLTVGALHDVARRFGEAGLSWVAMKGPVAASLLYPGVGDRSYNDLDLLVARRDYPAAMRVLEDLGYAHDIHNWALAEQMLAGQVGMAAASMHIDLHWHLHYSERDRRPFAFPIEEMIDRARQVALSGVATPTLDPVDTLLTLAFHAARSDGHLLMWFKDVERALIVDDPDLDELVRRSHAARCAGPVGLILHRARILLDAPVPPEVVRSLMPRSLRTAERATALVQHPVQLHDRGTMTRWFTRSVRASAVSTVLAVPERAARSLARTLFPPPENETDDPAEKANYLRAVSGSARG